MKAMTTDMYRRETRNLGISELLIVSNFLYFDYKSTKNINFAKHFTPNNDFLPLYTFFYHKSCARMRESEYLCGCSENDIVSFGEQAASFDLAN